MKCLSVIRYLFVFVSSQTLAQQNKIILPYNGKGAYLFC